MRRRDFFGVICGAAATWPAVARGQQQATPLVGYLGSDTPERYATRLASFRQGLNSMGFDEGKNVAIEYRWARGENGRLPALAQELVRANVQVIATPGTPRLRAGGEGRHRYNPNRLRNGRGPDRTRGSSPA